MKPVLAAILEHVPLLADPELERKRKRVNDEISDFIEQFP